MYYKGFTIETDFGFSGWSARFWKEVDPETGEPDSYSTGQLPGHDRESIAQVAKRMINRIIQGEKELA